MKCVSVNVLDASVCNNKQCWNDVIKGYVIKDLFGIQVAVSVNVIYHTMLLST